MHVSWWKKFLIIFFYIISAYTSSPPLLFVFQRDSKCTFISMHFFFIRQILTQAETNYMRLCTRVTWNYASIKVNKFLHVAISVAISVASLWILVRVTIRFRGLILRLDRRDADRRCSVKSQGGGSARTASSHREIPLARRKPRRFLLHFRHFFHREPVVPNHLSRDPVSFRSGRGL